MRCSDPVWRLNLIAINLKNIHRDKLVQILYGKPFAREFSPGIQMFPDTKFPQTFLDSKFADTARKIKACYTTQLVSELVSQC
jgi:hypothetical protein